VDDDLVAQRVPPAHGLSVGKIDQDAIA